MRRLALSLTVIVFTSCAPSKEEADVSKPDTGRVASAIFHGSDSPASDDFVVRILSDVGTCTGFLVAPRLVLTAQHCVGGDVNFAIGNDQTACSLQTLIRGPETFKVFLGPNALAPTAVAEVSRVFANVSKLSCDYDIAALELSEPVAGVTIRALQLDSPALKEESVEGIGFGRSSERSTSDTDSSEFTFVRQKAMGTILALDDKGDIDRGGQATTPSGSPVTVTEGYVLTDIRICSGDSGGPLVRTSTGDLLGVVHGYLTGAAGDRNGCDDSVSVYIPLWRQREFVERVFQTQGIMPTRVGRDRPPADLGGACLQDNDCHSNYCVKVGNSDVTQIPGTCSHGCKTSADCPASMECVASKITDAGVDGADNAVCLPPFPPPPESSCDVSPSSSSSSNGKSALLAFVAIVFARRRRSRASSS